MAGLWYYINYFTSNGYLPTPFVYDKSDTFMDLFNTLYWVYDEGRYTDWCSVYPPLGFLILKIINFLCNGSTFGDAANMRDNSIFVIVGFGLIYLSVPFLVLKTKYWLGFSSTERLLYYFIMILSTPMLFALERGNMIILAPVLLAIALAKIGFTRALCIALLINIKPYFALFMLYYLVRKNWKGFVSCALLSGLVFAITGLAFDNNFFDFFINLFSYSKEEELFSLREVMSMPSSISAFSYILKNPDGSGYVSAYLSSELTTSIINVIELTKWTVLFFSFVALFTKCKLMRDAEIIGLLLVLISNLGIWVGGYSMLLYIVLIPVLIKMQGRWFYIGALSLMAIPLDIITLTSDYIGEQYSYLGDTYADIDWTLGLGSFFRPVLNIILLFVLACEVLSRTLKDINASFTNAYDLVRVN